MLKDRCGLARAVIVLGAVVAAGILTWAVREPDTKDYLALRLLTHRALTHGSPYTAEAVAEEYERDYRERGIAAEAPTVGFIYPPALIPVVAPTTYLPFRVGFLVWWLALVGCAIAAVYALSRVTRASPGVPPLAVAVLLLHTITQSALSLGQTALLVAGGVALGTWAFAARRPVLGALLWGLAAVKPQLGLPFLLAALIQGGWRQVVFVAVGMGTLTIAGAAMTGEPVRTIRDYLPHASANVFAIGYNRVTNNQVIGWNRIWYVTTGQEINLTVTWMLLGFAVLSAAYWWRARRADREVAAGYWLAAVAMVTLVGGQAKGYDLVLTVFWLPYLVAGWRSGRRLDVWAFAAFLVVTALHRGIVVGVANAAGPLAPLADSYRAVATVALAVFLLVRGPVNVSRSS